MQAGARQRSGGGGSGDGAERPSVAGRPSVTVRLITPADAEATRLIYNAEVAGSTATFDLRARGKAEHDRWVAHHLGAHPAVVAVAVGTTVGDEVVGDEVVGDEVVGFASVSPYRERPAYATTVEDSVYVAAAWRGGGVGRALLQEVVRLAAEHGFHTMVARVEAGNGASIALHTSCGFTVVGTERQIGRKFGRWLDVTILQRML